jgi:thiol-disulfide isomerase/thioredoxin
VPIRDENGSVLTQEELIARLLEGSWAAEPIYDQDGNVLEIKVVPFGPRPGLGFGPGAPPPGVMVIDGNVPIHDQDGLELSMDDFMNLMSEGGWMPEPVQDEHGNLVSWLLRRDDDSQPMGGPPPGAMASFGGDQERWLGTPLPEFDLTTIEGRSLDSSVFNDRAVVLNFWFRACKPCLMEIPELNELVQEFSGEDVLFVALGLDSEDETQEALKEHPFAYEIVASTQELQQRLGIHGYPTNLVYDLDGRCTAVFSGYSPGMGDRLKHEIEEVLKAR